ncbi:hypothetical protein P4377_24345 [Bacillus thuringiensis]|nr:hypothetical protein [Bacillus thuringiensis]
MTSIYPSLIRSIAKHVVLWCYRNQVKLKTFSIYSPTSNNLLLNFEKEFVYTGNLSIETKLVKTNYQNSLSNNQDTNLQKKVVIPASIFHRLQWKNDYEFQIPEKEYMNPFLPLVYGIVMDSGMLMNLFSEADTFSSEIEKVETMLIGVTVKGKSTATIRTVMEKQYLSQPYEVTLYITGNVLIIGKDNQQYLVPIAELLESLQNEEGFSIEDTALVFHGIGQFTAEIDRKLKAFVKEQTWGPSPTELEYEVFPIFDKIRNIRNL